MIMNNLERLVIGPGSDVIWLENSTNQSTDIITKNCFGNFDTVACVRGVTLCFLNSITLILCNTRIITLHFAGGHSTIYCNYIVFFSLASLQCMLGTAEWIFGWSVHAALACQYLRALELLVLCYTYTKMTFRLLQRSESTAARISAAGLSLCIIYFTFFLIMAYVFQNSSWVDCYAIYWLFLSAGQFLLIQVIVLSSLLILAKIKLITTDQRLQQFRRRGLLWLITVLEISALFSFTYLLLILTFANKEISCSGVFHHKQLLYTPARMAYEVFVFLLPVWVTVYIFMPLQKFDCDHERLITSSGSTSTVRNPAILEHHYRSPLLCTTIDDPLIEDFVSSSYDTDFAHQNDHWNVRQRSIIPKQRNRTVGSSRVCKLLKKSKKCRSASSTLKQVLDAALETIPEETSGSGISRDAVTPPISTNFA